MYQCPTCAKWFVLDRGVSSCLVLHLPGDCCHYGDKEVPGPNKTLEQF